MGQLIDGPGQGGGAAAGPNAAGMQKPRALSRPTSKGGRRITRGTAGICGILTRAASTKAGRVKMRFQAINRQSEGYDCFALKTVASPSAFSRARMSWADLNQEPALAW